MPIRTSAAIGAYSASGPTEGSVVVTDTEGWAGKTKPPLIYCHGAGGTAFKSNDGTVERLLLTELAQDYVVIAGDFANDAFGNDTSMSRINDALSYIRANWSASNAAPVMVGGSMGGCAVLNYALDYPVTSVAPVIPLTDLNKAYSENTLGLKTAIDAAYGGTYDPATMAARNDPNTFASSLPNSIPIRLFVSNDDPYLAPSTAVQFKNNRPATTLQYIGNQGHSGSSLGNARSLIIPWIKDTSYPVQTVNIPAGPNLILNPTMETNVNNWTGYGSGTTPVRDTTEFKSGAASLKSVTSAVDYGFYSNYMNTTVGTSYTCTGWIKGSGGTVRLTLFRGSAVIFTGANVTLTSTWQQFSFTYTPVSGETNMTFFPLQTGSGTRTIYIDDVYFGTTPSST